MATRLLPNSRGGAIHYDYSELKAFLKGIRANVACGHSGHYGGVEGKLLHDITRPSPTLSGETPYKILEIGMNAGHSAWVFLTAAPHVHVTSVDIGYYAHTRQVADWFAERFPGRHRLLLGKSQQVLLEPEVTTTGGYDAAFIDGAHSYKAANLDLQNVRKLLRPGGLLIMDDVGNPAEMSSLARWHKGPTKAWYEAVSAGGIEEVGHDWNVKVAWGRYFPS